MEEHILICEDSLEGVFTGIYEAYARHYEPDSVRLQIGESLELRLFATYETIEPSQEKSDKVISTLKKILTEDTYYKLCTALVTPDENRAQVVYQTVVLALKNKNNSRYIMDRLTNDSVRKVFELSRNVWNEIHHLYGFLRFQELRSGVLFSRIGPSNNIVPFMMPHFSDRYPLENFIIYDEKHNLFGIHPASGQWYLVHNQELPQELLNFSSEEEKYSELFTFFCHKIAIKDRENLKLQRNMLPLRFQEYMVEFGKNEVKCNLTQ